MKSAIRITKALADPQRVRTLMLLQTGELCVCQIVEVLELAPSTVSKHLSILHSAGLVESRKEGRWIHYRLPGGKAIAPVRPVLKWLADTLADDEATRRDRQRLERVCACDLDVLCQRQRKR